VPWNLFLTSATSVGHRPQTWGFASILAPWCVVAVSVGLAASLVCYGLGSRRHHQTIIHNSTNAVCCKLKVEDVKDDKGELKSAEGSNAPHSAHSCQVHRGFFGEPILGVTSSDYFIAFLQFCVCLVPTHSAHPQLPDLLRSPSLRNEAKCCE
jgi:hypothetical protein